MPTFCSYCGRPLADGEVCHCRDNPNPQPTNRPAPPMANPAPQGNLPPQLGQPQPGFTPTAPPRPNVFQVAWGLIVNTFKRPADTMKLFAKNADYPSALLLIGADAILAALLLLITLLRSGVGGYFYSFSAARITMQVVLTLIVTCGSSALLAVFSMLFGNGLCGSKINYKQALCVAGAKSLASLPVQAVAIVIGLIIPSAGTGLQTIGIVLGWILAFIVFRTLTPEKENLSVYALLLTILCTSAAAGILSTLVASIAYGGSILSLF